MGIVPFLFGVAGRSELRGIVLNRLLVDVGLSTSAARALVARLRVAGHLASVRRGGGVDYRLAGDMERGFHRISAGAARSPEAWSGAFHALLYQVPEQYRAYRDLLRRSALLSGYGLLQPGVLIAPSDLSERMRAVLQRRPPGARVSSVELRMTREQAVAAVFEAWGLADLARIYRAHIHRLRAALGPSATIIPSARTLRRFAELSVTPLVDTLRDPALPSELLPERWPRIELDAVIADVHQRYGPAASVYVQGLLAEFE